ncbi:MAG: endonuclease/exonuclease/phosphatase family protein [Gemmatimonadota bacterium]|jgi:hypothetical protein
MRRSRLPRFAQALPSALTALLPVVLVAACSAAESPGGGVLLDGLFDEWSEAATLIDDPPDAPGAAVDILSVQAVDDPEWLYLALDVGNEVALQALPGTLRLLVDADANRSTGASLYDMNGVDLVVDLSQTETPLTEGRGAGFAIQAVASDGSTHQVERYALGLMASPTWAAPRFELRISRAGVGDVPPFDRTLRLGAVYLEGGAVLDRTEVGSFVFDTRRSEPTGPSDIAVRLARAAGAYRVTTWNVASGSFDRHGEDFARILGALEPDVVLLDELPGDISVEALEAFFQSPPLAALGNWHVVLGATGGVQRAAVAARGYELVPAEALTSLRYPEGSLERLAGGENAADAEDFLSTESDRGISAAGAWVTLDERRVLFVAADLQSGGWPGSLRDRLRTLQATIIRAGAAEELLRSPGPLVVGGDLNLVASRTPLFALARRLDADGSDLVPVDAVRLGERTLATWRNPRDLFAPGRLDFLLVPDAAMTVANSFVFTTEDLDDATLQRLGLDRESGSRISDHLAVVADLRFGADQGPATPPSDMSPTRN